LLPPLRNGETAQLHDPKIEDKETRPPPRYNEGTLSRFDKVPDRLGTGRERPGRSLIAYDPLSPCARA